MTIHVIMNNRAMHASNTFAREQRKAESLARPSCLLVWFRVVEFTFVRHITFQCACYGKSFWGIKISDWSEPTQGVIKMRCLTRRSRCQQSLLIRDDLSYFKIQQNQSRFFFSASDTVMGLFFFFFLPWDPIPSHFP